MSTALIDLETALEAITDTSPLVVSYTNDVTIDAVANTTLHWGGLPVMSADSREAADMLSIARACLINMGTVNERTEELMMTASEEAVREGLPVVFDPVGAGATPTRTRIAKRLLETDAPDIVKGNYGEISALAGDDATVRGVESIGEYADIAETAIALARRCEATVVASGETDIVATEERAYEVSAGDPMMGNFVGSGCMLGGTLATFLGGQAPEEAFPAAIAGTIAFGLGGERAAEHGEWSGPASYKHAFLDAIANLDSAAVSDVSLENRVTEITTR